VFDKNYPVVGGEAATTSFNNGYTFPCTYASLCRTCTDNIVFSILSFSENKNG
tara:strand:+ start:6048 stop:6206 length:159 start_codon:yes stop_codon:yes gene_type:complete